MTTPAADATLAARLQEAERQIRNLGARSNRSNLLALLVGALALAALSAYFWYGHQQLDRATRPDEVVTLAQGLLESNLPDARKQVEAEIVRTAPELARTLSKQALAALPGGRTWLAETLVGQVRQAFQETALLTEKEIRTFVRDNRPMIDRNLQRLATSETLAENEIREIIAAFEAQEGVDFKARADLYYDAAGELSEKLGRLAQSADLTPGEEIERRVFMLARRLQMETLGDASEPRPPAIAGGSDRTPDDDPAPSDGATPEGGPASAPGDAREEPAKADDASPAEPPAPPADAPASEAPGA
jgi:hypothetical protein